VGTNKQRSGANNCGNHGEDKFAIKIPARFFTCFGDWCVGARYRDWLDALKPKGGAYYKLSY